MDAGGLLAAIEAAIARDRLLAPGEPVLVGLSGGRDSIVLVHALVRLGHAVTAAHLDHALRPDSDDDAAWVAARCAEWGVPLAQERVAPPGLAPGEEAARAARLGFLERVARERGLSAIALGHHADDQAETVLFRLVRGSGPAGAGGMAPLRATPGGCRIVRPLLDLTRAQIVSLGEAWALPHREDPTNTDPGFARNRLRHGVLPELSRINPAAVPHLAGFAGLMREEAADRQEWARAIANHAVNVLAPGVVEVDRGVVKALGPVEARWLLREAAVRADVPHLASGALGRALRVAVDGGTIDLEDGLVASASGAWLVLYRPGTPPRPVSYTGKGAQQTGRWGWEVTVRQPEGHAPGDPTRVRFDAHALPRELEWRGAREDDEFRPWGRERSQGLHGFLTRQGVPAHRHRTLLVLASGTTVAWVVGIRRSSLAAVSNQTTEVVEMQATAGFPV